jgi:hypothetical protein
MDADTAHTLATKGVRTMDDPADWRLMRIDCEITWLDVDRAKQLIKDCACAMVCRETG